MSKIGTGSGTDFQNWLLVPFYYMYGNREKTLYTYINKDENPFTISTRHVEANVNTGEENQNDQNSSSNEVEDPMLKEMGTETVLIYFQNQRFFKKYITAQHSSKNANKSKHVMGLHLKTIIGVCNDLKLLYKDHSLESRHCILDTSAATTTYSKS